MKEEDCEEDKRKAVYYKIDEERIYQDGLEWHSEKKDSEHSIADWIIFMQKKLDDAKESIYELDEEDAITQIIKVTALGVACLEYNGVVNDDKKESK